MLLEKITSPQDLRSLAVDQLPDLASEIRKRMIEVVSITGGHLASSLGAVELTIALHYCFNTPKDRIIFDVGHQSYCHKMLTGRNSRFDSLRQYNGISGFPTKEESEYDTFTTGHSSNAVSLALGLVCARDYLKPSEHFRIAAVIGDGSLSGGLTFEGLNNAGHLKKDLLVILNTNELSIAPNVGALSTYLNKLISLPIYNRFRTSFENFLESRVPKGRRLKQIAGKFEEGLKGLFVPGIFFEELGFRYFGPLDGHNIATLMPTIKNIMDIKGPRILHVITKKGKGYPPAEEDPVRFHSVGSFQVADGAPLTKPDNIKSYTEVFRDKLVELAGRDSRIMAITAAMPEGTGLDRFRDLYPERFFDVGIAEGHAVSFAGGLAAGGFKPIVAIYSTFLQRAYDQIIVDVALQNLPVVLALDRAGIVGEDGVTHQGIFDTAYLRHIPNLVVMAPADAKELESMLEFAFGSKNPVCIRYPKANASFFRQDAKPVEFGKAEVLKKGKDFVLIVFGSLLENAVKAADLLQKQGLSGTLINARFVKPLDEETLKEETAKAQYIFTLEDGVIEGGFGSAVAEGLDKKVIRFGLPDKFIPHGKRDLLLEKYSLTERRLAESIKSTITGK